MDRRGAAAAAEVEQSLPGELFLRDEGEDRKAQSVAHFVSLYPIEDLAESRRPVSLEVAPDEIRRQFGVERLPPDVRIRVVHPNPNSPLVRRQRVHRDLRVGVRQDEGLTIGASAHSRQHDSDAAA